MNTDLNVIIAERLSTLEPSTMISSDTPRQYVLHVLRSEKTRQLVCQKLSELHPDGLPENVIEAVDQAVQMVLSVKLAEQEKEIEVQAGLRKKLLKLV